MGAYMPHSKKGWEIGQELLDKAGIEIENVREIVVSCKANELATLMITSYTGSKLEDAIKSTFEKYSFFQAVEEDIVEPTPSVILAHDIGEGIRNVVKRLDPMRGKEITAYANVQEEAALLSKKLGGRYSVAVETSWDSEHYLDGEKISSVTNNAVVPGLKKATIAIELYSKGSE